MCPSVLVLLKRCIADSDYEVRDRATFYISMLQTMPPAAVSKFVLNVAPVSAPALERALGDYLNTGAETPFDLKTVPVDATPYTSAKAKADPLDDFAAAAAPAAAAAASAAGPREGYAQQLATVPEFAGFGPLIKSSSPIALTEAETEYVVRCVKHIFPKHVVFDFTMTNTLNDQVKFLSLVIPLFFFIKK